MSGRGIGDPRRRSHDTESCSARPEPRERQRARVEGRRPAGPLAGGIVAAALVVAAAPAAHAGGLVRPNNISAHGVSLGGAFVAIADDATAWHFNPSGAAFAGSSLHLGAELVIAPRTFVPVDADGNRGEAQSPETPIVPVPAVGAVVRVSDRVTVGGGLWNTFGGRLSYPKVGLVGVIDQTQNIVLEAVGGVAYKINDRVAVGGAVRFGVGLFAVKTTRRPVDSDLSSAGAGLGASLGATWRVSDKVTLAGSWRSGLDVKTTGSGELLLPEGPLPVNVEHVQTWPQSASLGAAVRLSPRVRWAIELDWMQWSRLEHLIVTFPGTEQVNQRFPLDWVDNYSVRTGVEWRSSPGFALRGGTYFDTNAIPDQNLERQYLDRNKLGVSLGAGLGSGTWRVDVAADFTGGGTRTVPDNSADVGGFPDLANASPGEYSSLLFTFEAAVVRRL